MKIAYAFFLAGLLTGGMISEAQTVDYGTALLQVPPEAFREDLGDVNVSRTPLVAFTRHKADTESGSRDNRGQIVLDLQHLVQTQSKLDVCLKTSSNDGVFWSENPFLVDPGNEKKRYWRFQPITEEYYEEIERYLPEGLLPLAGYVTEKGDSVSTCARPERVYLPAVGSCYAPEINIYVNSSNRRMQAKVNVPETTGTDAILLDCREPEGWIPPPDEERNQCEQYEATVLFDKVCRLDASEIESSGVYELTMSFQNDFGIEEAKEQLLLPTPQE